MFVIFIIKIIKLFSICISVSSIKTNQESDFIILSDSSDDLNFKFVDDVNKENELNTGRNSMILITPLNPRKISNI